METLNQKLELLKDAHWDSTKLNLRQTVIHSIGVLISQSYEELDLIFQKRHHALGGFSADDLILIGYEHEVLKYFCQKYIPENFKDRVR